MLDKGRWPGTGLWDSLRCGIWTRSVCLSAARKGFGFPSVGTLCPCLAFMPSLLPLPEFLFNLLGAGTGFGPSITLHYSKLSKRAEPFLYSSYAWAPGFPFSANLTRFGITPLGMSRRGFGDDVNEAGRPAQNVGSTLPWLGTPDSIKRRKRAERQYSSLGSWLWMPRDQGPPAPVAMVFSLWWTVPLTCQLK